MEKSKKKTFVILIAVVAVIVIAMTLSMTVGMGAKTDYQTVDVGKILSAVEVKADITKLVKTTESTHAMYEKIKNTARYKEAKELILSIAGEMKLSDFSLTCARYLATFDDLHTNSSVYMATDDLLYDKNIGLDVDSNSMNIVLSYDKENFIPRGAVLLDIGGKSIRDIIEAISVYYPKENQVSKLAYALNYLFYPKMLELAGIKTAAGTMEFTFDFDGDMYTRKFKAITVEQYRQQNNVEAPVTPIVKPKNMTAKKLGDTLFLTITSCNDDGSFDALLESVKAEMALGTTKVVIDIRNNGGGSDGMWNTILRAMGFKHCSMGFDGRFSWVTRQYRNTVKMTGYSHFAFTAASENTKNIDLKVLMNNYTGSAAMTLVSIVRYSNIGKIIGTPSIQSPNYCGNAIGLQLDNSKIRYQIPTSYSYYEKDGKVVDNLLIPDITVPYLEDAIDYI